MRALGVTKMPSWLCEKYHMYPSIEDYEVATETECSDYWLETVKGKGKQETRAVDNQGGR